MHNRYGMLKISYNVTGAGHGIINASGSICWGGCNLSPRSVIRDVEDLVIVAPQSVDARPALYVPDLAGSIDWSYSAVDFVSSTSRRISQL